ncbi:2-dehydropantoate 2-reductase [Nocardia sp. NBC_01730]|uniref:ketopantoate reductase family protein n=1 Tax=Nocardia sp. NBC_01730 TaxID=2975998 RepID=UPI002E13D416|nr:2-dehydropantoate 2-reductase [Nocardia sp. NBC_01730]
MAHVVVIGAGGIGGYFAALLTEHGHAVTLLARGETLEEMTRSGLRVEEPACRSRVVTGVHPVSKLDGVPYADLVLVCVKSWQVAEAAVQVAQVVAAYTVVVPVQNGIEAGDRLAAILGADHAVGGVCTVFARRTSSATFVRMGDPPSLRIGSLTGDDSAVDRLKTIAGILTDAGISTQVSSDIRQDLWRKLMFIASFGGVAALSDAPAGVVRSQPRTRALVRTALHEVATVARAASANITEADADAALSKLDESDPDATASMMRDISAGRPSELYDQTGAVVHYGEWLGVPTPTHTTIYSALLPRELRARGDATEPTWSPPPRCACRVTQPLSQ